MVPHLSNCAVYAGRALACDCRTDSPLRYTPDIIAQYCAKCERPAGQRCKKPNGREANGPHFVRREAARRVPA